MGKVTTNLMNYEGKEVFVGLDVHKRHYAVACVCEGVLVKKATMKSGEENLLLFLRKYFPGAKLKTAYEAGFSGFVLHRYLEKNGIESSVVNAASIEVSSRDRVKTDKRDAVKIAKQLASGFLKGIHVPSERREAKRSLSRLRETVMKARKRAGNQLKSFLYLEGLIQGEDDTKVSKKWLKKVSGYSVDGEAKYCIDFFVNEWLSLENKVKEIDKRLQEQEEVEAKQEYYYFACIKSLY